MPMLEVLMTCNFPVPFPVFDCSTFHVNASLAPQMEVNLSIKRVIHHAPATIIYWEDGDKTVVKCCANDTYDPEKGFLLAYLKKIHGHTGLRKLMEKWCPDEAVMA